MAEWFEIKQNFIDWLKTQDDVDFTEGDNEFAPIKYSKQFKLFIEKHDGDDTLNMDSFTKKNTQKMETDTEKANLLEENKAEETAEEKEEGHLIEDMLKDYIADLDKEDAVFQAIDGIIDQQKDGEISNAERNMFIEKVTLDAFDEDATDFSFDDLVNSIEKIKKGDTEFLAGEAEKLQEDVPPPGNDDPGGGTYDPPKNDPKAKTDAEKISDFNKLTTNYESKTMEEFNLNIPEAKATLDFQNFNPANIQPEQLKQKRDKVITQLSTASEDFTNFQTNYAEADKIAAGAQDYLAANDAEYTKIIEELAISNSQVQLANDQIVSLQTTIDQTSLALQGQYITKDNLTLSLATIGSQISALESSKKTATGEDDEAEVERYNSQIDARIEELRQQENAISEQLTILGEKILENKAILDKSNSEIQVAYDNLTVALQNVSFADENQKTLALAVIQNKKVYSQATTDKNSCQAGMAAMDSYIQALNAQLVEIDKALTKKGEEVPQESATLPTYSQMVDGSIQFQVTSEVSDGENNEIACTSKIGETPIEYSYEEEENGPTKIKLGTTELRFNKNTVSISLDTNTQDSEGNEFSPDFVTTGNNTSVVLTDGTKITLSNEDGITTYTTEAEGQEPYKIEVNQETTDNTTIKTITVFVGDKETEKLVITTNGDKTLMSSWVTSTDPSTQQVTIKEESTNEDGSTTLKETVKSDGSDSATTVSEKTTTTEYKHAADGALDGWVVTVVEIKDGKKVTTVTTYDGSGKQDGEPTVTEEQV